LVRGTSEGDGEELLQQPKRKSGKERMREEKVVTRRDFLRGTAGSTLAVAFGGRDSKGSQTGGKGEGCPHS